MTNQNNTTSLENKIKENLVVLFDNAFWHGEEGEELRNKNLANEYADEVFKIFSSYYVLKEDIKNWVKIKKKEIYNSDSEAWGWDLIKEIGPCCPGDDATNVYERALSDLLSHLQANTIEE